MLNDPAAELQDVICLLGSLYCLVRHALRNRQDRTLFRLHNCLISGLSGMDKGLGQRLDIYNLFSLDLPGKTAEQLG